MHLMPMVQTTTSNGVQRRYRSGLEEAIAHQIASANLPVIYEETTLDYIWLARPSRYTPDFQIHDIHLEVKGLFDVQARHKMLLVKQQHPDLDIRFVFSNAKAPIYKGSSTNYGQWCDKHGFLWADRRIPDDWLIAPKHEGDTDVEKRSEEPARPGSGCADDG